MAERKNPGRTMSEAQLKAMHKREARVLELRATGMSFEKINQTMKIKNAHQTYKRAIARDANIEHRRAEALRLEEIRLDALQEGIWGRAIAGEPRAVEVALKVLERRARLLGLDFADLISGKLVEIEQAKAAVMAQALVGVLQEADLSTSDQQRLLRSFFDRLRALDAAPSAAPDTVPGVLAPAVPAEDEDLL